MVALLKGEEVSDATGVNSGPAQVCPTRLTGSTVIEYTVLLSHPKTNDEVSSQKGDCAEWKRLQRDQTTDIQI